MERRTALSRLGPVLRAALCCALALPLSLTLSPRASAATQAHPPAVSASAPSPVSPALARRARALVQSQLDAFAADDALRAFSFAAPAIRKGFDGPDHFMAMVRTHYPVVHRPASVTFLKAAWIDGTLTQGVQMTDANGTVWLAVYRLEQQRDKSWRIAACEVFASQGRMV